MDIIYVPIMAAKQGEFDALKNLPQPTSDKALPLFELPPRGEKTAVEGSILRTATKAGKVWSKRKAFLDISKWSSDARTESGIHVLEYSFSQFSGNGIDVHPVIGYDRWSDPIYRQALINIRAQYPVTPCIRLDREAIRDDLYDVDYFFENISDIMTSLNLGPENCYILADYGDVSNTSVPDLIESTDNAVSVLRSLGFGIIIVAGGSMPSSVDKAVSSHDDIGCIPRIEMQAWKAVFSGSGDRAIVFGDYLIRSPHAADGVIAPHANAKIRYTIENQFFVVRGHSKNVDSLCIQHKWLAEKLVSSVHFMPGFSWGDDELFYCSLGVKEIRSPTTMIAIDSNHHIRAVIAEVFEYQKGVVATTTKAS